jgi:capsular exopolysaccharide synthesis family protein
MSLWVAVVLGVVAGLVFGVGAALLRSALDTRLRGREALRRITRAPVLTTVPADPTTARTPLVTDLPAHSIRGEAFRRLRTNLKYAQVGDSSSSVLVTSSIEGEGKTTSSINLAIVMAKAGKRVALVDADLRRPRVASLLGLENAAGITTALVGAAEVGDLLQAWGDDELYVLTAGEIPPNPTELLESHQMATILSQLTAEFDLVVIDGPPLLPVADGLVLAQQVGRVILVAGVGQVRVGEVQEALGALALVDADRVGIVLNKVTATSGEAGAYGRAYAAYAPDGDVAVASVAEVEGAVRTQARGRGPDGPTGRSRDARADERGQDERGHEERRLVQEAWS